MTPTINAGRLWQSLMEMAQIGATPEGGNCRLALFAEDTAARALFLRWCQPLGLHHEQDAIGNMFLRRDGGEPTAGAVAFGSHLDTVPTGGRFDGAVRRACRAGDHARAGRCRRAHAHAAGTGELDQRGRQPVPAGDDGQPRACRRHDAGGGARHHR